MKVSDYGTFIVDDIRITDRDGRLVAAENAEGPTIVPGPLNFQLIDATALQVEAGATVFSAHVKDLDGDRYPETIMTIMNANDPRRVSAFEPLIVESSATMRLATADFFPAGAPKVKNSPVTVFGDLNGDGLDDIVFAEAGLDFPPWTGDRIGVGLSVGGGKYRDVSSLVPPDQHQNRAAAVAVGDVSGDGRIGIILPDSANDGRNTAVLRWNGNGFDQERNWVPAELWRFPGSLATTHGMALADFDGDGKQDLVAGGNFSAPTLRILFGASQGFANTTAANLLVLPDGPFGHAGFGPFPPDQSVRQGSEVDPVIVADFNNDGLPDIFAGQGRMREFKPGVFADRNYPSWETIFANGGVVLDDWAFQAFINGGNRTFVESTGWATAQILPLRWYSTLMPVDMNNDGFTDVVGLYQTKLYAGVERYWGTTLFLNDGTGAFQVVDGVDLLVAVTTTPSDGRKWNLGAFLPTRVTRDRLEAIVYEPLGGCVAGSCSTQGLNLYKVVANSAIGTGPNFSDSARLGVPGFNEFYYLRHYPEAAAAVQRGEYSHGLAHYLAVGRDRGYRPHAPVARDATP